MHSADDRFDLVSVLRQPLSLRHARGTPLTADHKNFVPRQTDPFEQMVIEDSPLLSHALFRIPAGSAHR